MSLDFVDQSMEEPENGGEEPAEETGLTDDQLQEIIAQEIDSAINFIESDIAPDRIKATQYARGEPFGDEETGRSQFISRDVADTTNAIVPGLMRTFFGPEHVVEYVPAGPDQVDMAEQATDYVQHIITKDNPGFLIVHSVVKDLLIRKCGIVKYWWDRRVNVSVSEYTGIDIMQMIQLEETLAADGAAAEVVAGELDPQSGLASIRLKIKRVSDGVRVEAVPLDEFFINAEAKGFGPREFRTMGHGRDVPMSDLVALGYPPEEVEEARGASEWRDNQERLARMPIGETRHDEPADESQEPIYYAEVYSYVDQDGDGLAELWKFCVAGPGRHILHKEIVDEHPFAEFPCDPEPHVSAIAASSIADRVMDIQKNKSGVTRATLDSLAEAVTPRTVIGQGINVADALNTERGAMIRATASVDNIRELTKIFVGPATFPMLAYLDEVREGRTGMSKTSMGLNPESLQNMTALAAANQFDRSHEVQELIARIMAETGFKRLFRGILKLIVQNQRKARMVQLRGKWVNVDPSAYKADMDVTANVALGATEREKISALDGIINKQEAILGSLGPENPLVGLKEYHNALGKRVAMVGFKNVNAFFKDPSAPPDPNAPQPQGQQQQDPKALAELQKQQNDARKLELEFMKLQNDADQKNADRQQETMLKIYEINVRSKTNTDVATIKALAEGMRVNADLRIQASEAMNGKARAAVSDAATA